MMIRIEEEVLDISIVSDTMKGVGSLNNAFVTTTSQYLSWNSLKYWRMCFEDSNICQ